MFKKIKVPHFDFFFFFFFGSSSESDEDEDEEEEDEEEESESDDDESDELPDESEDEDESLLESEEDPSELCFSFFFFCVFFCFFKGSDVDLAIIASLSFSSSCLSRRFMSCVLESLSTYFLLPVHS